MTMNTFSQIWVGNSDAERVEKNTWSMKEGVNTRNTMAANGSTSTSMTPERAKEVITDFFGRCGYDALLVEALVVSGMDDFVLKKIRLTRQAADLLIRGGRLSLILEQQSMSNEAIAAVLEEFKTTGVDPLSVDPLWANTSTANATLQELAILGEWCVMGELLRRGEHKSRILTLAIKYGSTDIVKKALDAGAEPSDVDISSFTSNAVALTSGALFAFLEYPGVARKLSCSTKVQITEYLAKRKASVQHVVRTCELLAMCESDWVHAGVVLKGYLEHIAPVIPDDMLRSLVERWLSMRDMTTYILGVQRLLDVVERPSEEVLPRLSTSRLIELGREGVYHLAKLWRIMEKRVPNAQAAAQMTREQQGLFTSVMIKSMRADHTELNIDWLVNRDMRCTDMEYLESKVRDGPTAEYALRNGISPRALRILACSSAVRKPRLIAYLFPDEGGIAEEYMVMLAGGAGGAGGPPASASAGNSSSSSSSSKIL